MARIMHLLNSLGHATIHWEPSNDELIIPVIQTMLDRQFKFFVLSESGEVPVTSTTELADRRVILPDETLQQLYDTGLLHIGGVSIADDAETTGAIATTPEEVIENDTIAVQPAHGG